MGASKASGIDGAFTAALTLALASGASIEQAGEIGQAAISAILPQCGTATCSRDELLDMFRRYENYVADWDELHGRLERLRRDGKRIVFTNGIFDILHSGHVFYLEEAKALGDVLVVALNSDASARRLKGSERPFNTLRERANVVAGLGAVDFVTSFTQSTPVKLLELLRPEIYVKGGDYTRESLPEAPAVEHYGGRVEIVGYISDRSTTNLVSRIRHTDNAEPVRP